MGKGKCLVYRCGDIVMNCEPYITNDIKEMTELAQQIYNNIDTEFAKANNIIVFTISYRI